MFTESWSTVIGALKENTVLNPLENYYSRGQIYLIIPIPWTLDFCHLKWQKLIEWLFKRMESEKINEPEEKSATLPRGPVESEHHKWEDVDWAMRDNLLQNQFHHS